MRFVTMESSDVEGISGQYFFKEAIEERISPLAQDKTAAEKLWNKKCTIFVAHLLHNKREFSSH